MKSFAAVAPGAIWCAIILGLSAGAAWLSQFYGALAWVPPLAGFLTIVAVPILKVLATNEAPATRTFDGADAAPPRSKLSRWLL